MQSHSTHTHTLPQNYIVISGKWITKYGFPKGTFLIFEITRREKSPFAIEIQDSREKKSQWRIIFPFHNVAVFFVVVVKCITNEIVIEIGIKA